MKAWQFRASGLTLLVFIAAAASWADSPLKPALPELPLHLQAPFADISNHHEYKSADEFDALLESLGYTLESVRANNAVPQVFSLNIPPHLASLTVPAKTSTFIRLLLPNVVKVNANIEAVRADVIELRDKAANGEALTDEESQWLADLGNDYGQDGIDFDELLLRVDVVPVAMVLAQGIDESGWGTSRFAIEGNALYGQHLASAGGKFLTTSNGKVKVAAFDNIYHSTASYIHNLNSTRAYASFRESREKLRNENETLTGQMMVAALAEYSERGQDYVNDLQSIIRHHQLDAYDAVMLQVAGDAAVVSFTE